MPIFKQKGDSMECGSYGGVKLLEHALKLLERVLEKRLRELMQVNSMQCGFMKGKSIISAIFMVRQIQEKYLEKNRCLYQAFIDLMLEKAYDRVPREVIYWSLHKKLVPEKLIQVVKAMYKGACIMVRICGVSEEFDIKVGLHQGSVLSPFLFTIVIDVLSKDVRKGAPWELLFADDLVITVETKEELQERVVEWQGSMESGALRMNAEKSEVVVLGRRDGPVNGNIQDTRGK